MKRITLVVALAVMLASLMVGTVVAQSAPVDLEFWLAGAVTEAAPPPDNWSGYKIIKDKLGINLKLTLIPATPADQDTKLNTAAAANRLPDLFFSNRDAWMKLVQKGLIGQTDDILKLMPNRNKKYYTDPDEQELIKYNGKRYGFADPGASLRPQVEGLVIRKDWLDKLKLKMPTTTDELFAVAKAFSEQDPDGNGKKDTYGYGAFIETDLLLNAGLGRRFYPILGAFGVSNLWDASAKSFGLTLRKPEYMEALGFVKKMQEAKVIDPDWATLKKEEFRTRWKEGKFGIMWEQFGALATTSNYGPFDKNFPNGEWVAMPAIKGPKGLASNSVVIKAVRIYGVSARAAKDPAKVAAIAKFYEWMSTEEGYLLLAFGEKGVNYNLDDKGNITYAGIAAGKKTTDKDMQPLTQFRNLVYTNDARELLSRYPDYKTIAGRTMDPKVFLNQFNTLPSTNGTASSFINSPANAADFQRYVAEGIIKFVMGQTPLDKANYDKFVAGLDSSVKANAWEKDAKAQLAAIGWLR